MTRSSYSLAAWCRTGPAAALATLALTVAPRATAAQAAFSAPHRPSLVVFLTVDQMRAEYFDRWAGQLSGGFARLRREAVFAPDGRHLHALTETAPGHATLLSGRHPAHTNILSNDRGVVDGNFPLIGASGDGASPLRFRGTSFFDWLKAADSSARALSVSRKNRSAILPVGRAKENVFWWGGTTGFTTSRYYADTLPAWLVAWNRTVPVSSLNGYRWTLLREEAVYPEADVTPWERGGKDNAFPHVLSGEPAALASQLEITPLMDSLTLAAALAGVKAMQLGQRGHTDYLSVSLSTTDAIGHRYGPDSRELHDQILRLDQYLGAFLTALDSLVPPQSRILGLSADHGVTSYAEQLQARGQSAGRIDLTPMADSLARAWRARWGTDFGVSFDNGLLYADDRAMAARGVNVPGVARQLAAQIQRHAGVARTFTATTLTAAPASDSAALAWRRTLSPEADWLVAAVARTGWVFADDATRAQHGTWSLIDQRVPVLFVAPGVAARTLPGLFPTVDIAPTLAALLGISPTEPTDGRARRLK